jgi:hypothetical protein
MNHLIHLFSALNEIRIKDSANVPRTRVGFELSVHSNNPEKQFHILPKEGPGGKKTLV